MKRFDQELKQKLYNHEAPVPSDAWESISVGLVEDGSKKYILFYWLSGLVVIALVALLAVNTIQPNMNNSSVVSNETLNGDNSDSIVLPMESEINTEDEVINNLVITKSSLNNNKEIDISDSEFIENLRAIKEKK